MTEPQLKALQAYVAAVVRVMTRESDAHAQNVQLLLDAKHFLEVAFRAKLPDDKPPLPNLL